MGSVAYVSQNEQSLLKFTQYS